MQITIDTANLSELDYQVLALLGGVATGPADEAETRTAPKTTSKPKATKAEEPPAEDTGPDISVAVAKATELVSAGETARVKDALKQIGVSRVSELTEDQVQTFLDLLDV